MEGAGIGLYCHILPAAFSTPAVGGCSMTTKEKASAQTEALSEGETASGKSDFKTENSTPDKCRVCGERLRLDEKNLCPDCRYWQQLLNWAKPQGNK